MPPNFPRPKHRLGAGRASAQRQFTDREGFFETFDRALAEREAGTQEFRVLVQYGIGGIGKTRLRTELLSRLHRDRPELPIAVLDFDTPDHRDADNALAVLRHSLGKDYGVDFRRFDIAFVVYWKKARPTIPMTPATIPFLEEGSMIANVVSTLGHVPFVGFLPALAKAFQKGEKVMVDWWTKRGQKELADLPGMEPARIRDLLPAFWAADVREHIETKGTTAVLCIDTYEKLAGGERAESAAAHQDEWVRELVAQLPEALWLISGREKLRWDEFYPDWRGCLDQHLVGGLSSADSEGFLVSCGVSDAAVRQAIVQGSEGVPFYLDLAVDSCDEVTEKGRVPGPADFAGTPRELLDRFLRYLNDAEVETLKLLAVARFWDRALFEMLVNEFKTGYPLTAFDRLCRFSFVNEGAVAGARTMHGLMGATLREHTDPELVGRVHSRLFDYYAAQVKDLDVRSITAAHATALVEAFYHGRAALSAREVFDWLRNPAQQFSDAAQWGTVLPLYRECALALETELGPAAAELATCLNHLGLRLAAHGEQAEAESIHRRALAMREKTLPADDPNIASSLCNLACVLGARGGYAEAESLVRRALTIDERTQPASLPDIATDLSILAGLFEVQGRYAEAEPLGRRTLEIREKAMPENHPSVALSLCNLAWAIQCQGRYAEAEPLHRRALEMRERFLPEGHPDIATSLNNYACLLRAQARYAEAEPLFRRALAMREKALPEGHPTIAVSLNDFAGMLEDRSRLAEAEPLYRRALEIREKALGKDHPKTKATRDNLNRLLGKSADS
jgi:tetratricopeptide (TPR) repeat protein